MFGSLFGSPNFEQAITMGLLALIKSLNERIMKISIALAPLIGLREVFGRGDFLVGESAVEIRQY